jgi:hypothetical protein
MTDDSNAPSAYCSPDKYTFGYLGILFGDLAKGKDAKEWMKFWNENKGKLVWNDGVYVVKE